MRKRKEILTPAMHAEPEPFRRKMVEECRKLAASKRFKPPERAEFRRMADAWAATLTRR